MDPSYTTRLGAALRRPFEADMSWAKLALVVGFVLIVAVAWRQVVLFIADEV